MNCILRFENVKKGELIDILSKLNIQMEVRTSLKNTTTMERFVRREKLLTEIKKQLSDKKSVNMAGAYPLISWYSLSYKAFVRDIKQLDRDGKLNIRRVRNKTTLIYMKKGEENAISDNEAR